MIVGVLQPYVSRITRASTCEFIVEFIILRDDHSKMPPLNYGTAVIYTLLCFQFISIWLQSACNLTYIIVVRVLETFSCFFSFAYDNW